MLYPHMTQFETRDHEVAQRLRLREETAPYRRAARLARWRRRRLAFARLALVMGATRELSLGQRTSIASPKE